MVRTSIQAIDFYHGLERSRDLLLREKDVLNQMNYFPVADRDTGTNMAISLQQAIDFDPADFPTFSALTDNIYLRLMDCGHGNSGTIMTLYFDGFSAAMPDTGHIDAAELVKALQGGAGAAYDAVSQPKEGTILSVMDAAANAAASIAEATDDIDLVLRRACEEAREVLLRTHLTNPSRTTDSGAYGFCLILEGLLGEEHSETLRFFSENAVLQEVPYRYCTEVVLEKSSPKQEIYDMLSGLGDCLLVVQKESLTKVHIHTQDPQKVLDLLQRSGTIHSKKIDDMLAQQGV